MVSSRLSKMLEKLNSEFEEEYEERRKRQREKDKKRYASQDRIDDLILELDEKRKIDELKRNHEWDMHVQDFLERHKRISKIGGRSLDGAIDLFENDVERNIERNKVRAEHYNDALDSVSNLGNALLDSIKNRMNKVAEGYNRPTEEMSHSTKTYENRRKAIIDEGEYVDFEEVIDDDTSNKFNSEDLIRTERLNLAKINMLKNGISKPEALNELYEITTKNVTPVVLAGSIMGAEDISFIPVSEDKEVVNPSLIPAVLKVVDGAIKNPNSAPIVLDVADKTTTNILEQKTQFDERIQKNPSLQDLSEKLDSLMKQVEIVKKQIEDKKVQERQKEENAASKINTEQLRIAASSKYMGARGSSLWVDGDGHALVAPRNFEKKDVVKLIQANSHKPEDKKQDQSTLKYINKKKER